MISEADKNEMCRMRRLGFTLDYIAKATGYSAASVARRISASNLWCISLCGIGLRALAYSAKSVRANTVNGE